MNEEVTNETSLEDDLNFFIKKKIREAQALSKILAKVRAGKELNDSDLADLWNFTSYLTTTKVTK